MSSSLLNLFWAGEVCLDRAESVCKVRLVLMLVPENGSAPMGKLPLCVADLRAWGKMGAPRESLGGDIVRGTLRGNVHSGTERGS